MENRRILLSCDGFRNADLGIDLIANAFRGSMQNTIFLLCSIIYLSENGRRLILSYPQRIVQIIHYLYSKDGSLMIILFSTKCFLFVCVYKSIKT